MDFFSGSFKQRPNSKMGRPRPLSRRYFSILQGKYKSLSAILGVEESK